MGNMRRIPYYGEFETPSGYLLPLADNILTRKLEECELFIGWQQISLNCMKRSHSFGAITVLEHQTASVWKWMELMTEE